MKTLYIAWIAAFMGMVILYVSKYVGKKDASKFSFSYWIKDNIGSMLLSILSTVVIMIMINFNAVAEAYDIAGNVFPILKYFNLVALAGTIAGYYGTWLFRFLLKGAKENIKKSNGRR